MHHFDHTPISNVTSGATQSETMLDISDPHREQCSVYIALSDSQMYEVDK